MEILIGIASKIAECTVEPVGQWLCYPFNYSSNIDSMRKQAEKLKFARERMQHSIHAAIIKGEEIYGDVKKWLEDADKITKEAMKVEAKTKGPNGACLNLKPRHHLSRKAKKIVKDIDEILKDGNFARVSYRPAVRLNGSIGSCYVSSPSFKGIPTTRNMDYVAAESRMSTAKRIMEALRDDNIHMIGVWGMAGVGKTTLVREIGRQAKEEKVFNEVAMASVTCSPDLRRIQEEIADMLDLKFDMETVIGRACRLRERLTKTKDKKILVILDDIWEGLDLEAIGIPSMGCKVLLASRNRNVLSCEMDTQRDFGLEVLDDEEAWSLFEKKAGDCVGNPIMLCIATEVVKECAGLPLALVTVSKALKNRRIYEWKDALQQLRTPLPGHQIRMLSTIYSSIELSYKHLKSKEVQDVFLVCAQLGYNIDKRYLLRYCYGLGLLHGINTMEGARNRLYTILRILKDSSLLQQSPFSSQVLCMCKVVRDVAMLIALRDGNMYGGDLPLRISHMHGGDHNMYGRDCPLQISDTNSQISEQLNLYGGDQNIYGGDRPLHISHMHGGDHNMYARDCPLQISDTNSQISEQMKEVIEQWKEVATTLKEALNKSPIDAYHLSEEVMKMEEYEEVMLASAFDHLMYDYKAARAFLAKNARLFYFFILFFIFYLEC